MNGEPGGHNRGGSFLPWRASRLMARATSTSLKAPTVASISSRRKGTFLTVWMTPDTSDSSWSYPRGIAVDGAGNVYVTDWYLDRALKYDSNGGLISWWGEPGVLFGQFSGPSGIAVNPGGIIFVVDTGNNRVQGFLPVLHTNFLSWGYFNDQASAPPGTFNEPRGIAIDGDGNIYVADSHHYRIQKFAPTGTFLDSWYVGWVPGWIAVDAGGNMYVTDYNNNRVRVWARWHADHLRGRWIIPRVSQSITPGTCMSPAWSMWESTRNTG